MKSIINLPIRINPEKINFREYLTLEEYYLAKNIHRTLVKLNKKNEIISDLAESWKVLNNGKKYKFIIKKNIKWSDGSNIYAKDVAESIFLNNLHQNKNKILKYIKKNNDILRVDVVDETIEVNLKQKSPSFLNYLTTSSFSLLDWKNEHLKKNEIKYSGPYKIKKINQNLIELDKNIFYENEYNNNAPEKIIFKLSQNIKDVNNMIKKSKIDFLELRTESQKNLIDHSKYNKIYGSYDLLYSLQTRKVNEYEKEALSLLNQYLNRGELKIQNYIPTKKMKMTSYVSEWDNKDLETKHIKQKIKNISSKNFFKIELMLQKNINKKEKKIIDFIVDEAKKIGIIFNKVEVDNFFDKFNNEDYQAAFKFVGTYSANESSLWFGYFCVGYKAYSKIEKIACEDYKEANNMNNTLSERKYYLQQAYEKVMKSGYFIPLYFKPREFFILKKWNIDQFNRLEPYPSFNYFEEKNL